MNKQEREHILFTAKNYFRETIAKIHLKNAKMLTSEDEFNINPFTWTYLAQFAFGNTSPESLAKVLIYPEVLGTSINKSFDAMLHKFPENVFRGYASTIEGIDIEFKDAIDGHHKFCQLKTGSDAIKEEDVKTIEAHFQRAKKCAEANNLCNATDDCIVGVLYGEKGALSVHFAEISKNYPVLIGQEFWEHLTGDRNYYTELADAFASVADELASYDNLQRTIQTLAYDIGIHEKAEKVR